MMSLIKKILAATYSLRMNFSEFTGIGIKVNKNDKKIKAQVSFLVCMPGPIMANK